MMQTRIRQVWATLGNKHEETALFSFAVLETVIEQASCIVGQINITRLCPFSPQMKPPSFWADMSITHL